MADVATFSSPSAPASEPACWCRNGNGEATPRGHHAGWSRGGAAREAAAGGGERCCASSSRQTCRRRRQAGSFQIDDVRLSSIREIEELFPARIQSLKLPSKDDLAAEIASHWKEQMEMYRGQAEELAQRLEKQAADLRRELAKSQEFVDKMSREIEPQIHAKMNESRHPSRQ